MRIIHLSDIHVWRYAFNPLRLLNKRAVGMFELVAGRARKFRLERLHAVVERVVGLSPDHILITGDLTTTALPEEFRAARAALADLLVDSTKVTVLPGNHDRYTPGSIRRRHFEEWFGAFTPPGCYPWLRMLDEHTGVLGLDATRSHLSATGFLPPKQLDRAQALLADASKRPERLIIANHYPAVAPSVYVDELRHKRLKNAADLLKWLGSIGPHIYCCGHVHAAWAFVPRELPDELCLNSGAPLMRDPTGLRPPGFLEIVLHDRSVSVNHHAWSGDGWVERPLDQKPSFFALKHASPTPVPR